MAGTNKALIAAAEVAVQYEANIKFLPHCPVGLHSPFGAAASAVMFDALKSVNIRPPRIPVIMNADLTAHYDPAKIRMVRSLPIASLLFTLCCCCFRI